MLVCNVSLRPQRTGIAAALAEAGAAVDVIGIGAVFAPFVDAPAFASDSVNGFLGSIMLEAASASDAVAAAGSVFAGTVSETATVADTGDGAVISGFVGATFDGLATNVVVSNGNLTALHNVNTTNSGVISTAFKSSGKYYFEVVLQGTSTPSNYLGIMVSTWSSVFSATSMTTNSTSIQLGGTGTIFSNGATTGKQLGAHAVGDVYSAAIDLTGRLGWFRKNGGNWNNDASANPATGTGGVTIASGSFAPIVRFALSGTPTDQMTANFGQSSFVYTAPSGFGGWPA